MKKIHNFVMMVTNQVWFSRKSW